MSDWLFLLVQIPSGILIYVLMVAGAKLNAWHEARSALGQALTPKFVRFLGSFWPYFASRGRARMG